MNSNKPPEMPKNPLDQIAAYCDGEMSPNESRAFERFAEQDPETRARLAEWQHALSAAKDWTLSDAPGVEKVAAIPMPSVVRPARVVSLSPWRHIIRAAAVAAIFITGVLVGHFAPETNHQPSRGQESQITKLPVSQQSPAQMASEPTATPKPLIPRKALPPHSKQQSMELADNGNAASAANRAIEPLTGSSSEVHYASDEKGRIIIETTLKISGARALWVVDGSFALAQSAREQ